MTHTLMGVKKKKEFEKPEFYLLLMRAIVLAELVSFSTSITLIMKLVSLANL